MPNESDFSLEAYETYLANQEHAEYLQTLLTFKTVKCRNPLHFSFDANFNPSSYAGTSQELKVCRYYHCDFDKRRPLLSAKAMELA